MTPTARLLDRIGWSAPKAAVRLGYARTTIDAWCSGINSRKNASAPPDDVLQLLIRIADAIEGELALY